MTRATAVGQEYESRPTRKTSGNRDEHNEIDYFGSPTSRWDEISRAWQEANAWRTRRLAANGGMPPLDGDPEEGALVTRWSPLPEKNKHLHGRKRADLAAPLVGGRRVDKLRLVDRLMREAERGVRDLHRSTGTSVGSLRAPQRIAEWTDSKTGRVHTIVREDEASKGEDWLRRHPEGATP